jgi:small subunit ribosomal protein S1
MAYKPNFDNSEQPTMAELLASEEAHAELRTGRIVKGQVMGMDENGISLSVGYKFEGMIPSSEIRSIYPMPATERFKIGDSIDVMVLDTKARNGQIMLSFDRAQSITAWAKVENSFEQNESVSGIVTGHNRGGVVVNVDGLQCFIPLSHVVIEPGYDQEVALTRKLGSTVTMKAIEVNRKKNKAVFSERNATQEEKNILKGELLQGLVIGDRREGTVTGISKFGAFVDIGGVDGLVHLTELSWNPVKKIDDFINVGQTVNVEVISIDNESKRIGLSMRRLTPTPWSDASDKYSVGQLISGQITKLSEFGAFAKVGEGIEGLIHISELTEKHINHPKDIVTIGDTLELKIISLDPVRRRLGLSLKQAAEDEDWPTEYFDPVD